MPERFITGTLAGIAAGTTLIAGVLWSKLPTQAEAKPTRVIRVVDADTLEITEPVAERLRLRNIDAPETWLSRCDTERRIGREATQLVTDRIRRGREVTITRSGERDRYHRSLVLVAVDGEDLGELLLSRGLALRWAPGPEAKARRIAHWCGSRPGGW